MKKYLSFCLCFISLGINAQQQLIKERKYKVDGLDKKIYVSAINKQGNIFYSGSTLVSANNFTSYFLSVKPNTDTIWIKKGPANLNLVYQAAQLTPDGGFVFCGASKHPSIGAISGLLMQKLTPAGVSQWSQNNYLNNSSNAPASLLVMPDKGYLVGGFLKYNGYSFLRTDSLGNHKWIRSYTHSDRDIIVDMQFTKAGNIITAGMTKGNSNNTWQPRLLLINHKGDSLKGNQFTVRGLNRKEGMYINWNSLT